MGYFELLTEVVHQQKEKGREEKQMLPSLISVEERRRRCSGADEFGFICDIRNEDELIFEAKHGSERGSTISNIISQIMNSDLCEDTHGKGSALSEMNVPDSSEGMDIVEQDSFTTLYDLGGDEKLTRAELLRRFNIISNDASPIRISQATASETAVSPLASPQHHTALVDDSIDTSQMDVVECMATENTDTRPCKVASVYGDDSIPLETPINPHPPRIAEANESVSHRPVVAWLDEYVLPDTSLRKTQRTVEYRHLTAPLACEHLSRFRVPSVASPSIIVPTLTRRSRPRQSIRKKL